MFYFVTETKGTTDESRLQWSHERKKIECGRAHSRELGVGYDVVSKAGEIRVRPGWVDRS